MGQGLSCFLSWRWKRDGCTQVTYMGQAKRERCNVP